MGFSKIPQLIDELNHDLRAYVTARLEHFELMALKKGTEVGAKIGYKIAATFFFTMFLVMASVAVAILIGRALNDLSLGFFIVAGAYFLIFIGVLIFGKKIFRRRMLKKISKEITNARQSDGD